MSVKYKLAFDAEDPHRLAGFWAEALGYVVEDNSTMIRSLLDSGGCSSRPCPRGNVTNQEPVLRSPS